MTNNFYMFTKSLTKIWYCAGQSLLVYLIRHRKNI